MTRIRSVTPISVRYPEPNDSGALRHLTLCRIESDDGTVGWGEAVTSWPDVCRATEAMIEGIGGRARRRARPARQRRHLAPLQAAGLVVRQPGRRLVVRALGDRHRALGSQGEAARRARRAAARRRAPRAAAGDREHASAAREPRGRGRPARAATSGELGLSGLQVRARQEGRGTASAARSSATSSSCGSCASGSGRSRC